VVVDTTGRAEMVHFHVYHSDHPAFTDAVRQTVATTQFAPGMIGRERARSLLRVTYRFSPAQVSMGE
jgi:hypothetical protein